MPILPIALFFPKQSTIYFFRPASCSVVPFEYCLSTQIIDAREKKTFSNVTRMHSSRMCTARSLTVYHGICLGGHAWHAHCHAHPFPCMPPATHAPCHTCPLPCMPPAMHTPCHACPPATHACLPCHACPPCGQTDTCKNNTFANFVCRR